MKITPLATESLGTRSMATLVETPDVAILPDPSVRLGPYQYDLPRHLTEEERQRASWRTIRDAPKKMNKRARPVDECGPRGGPTSQLLRHVA